jgi:membrane-associated phospholipid phosphatase
MDILAMAALMTLLVGLSRIALGVHCPPEGLTGW